MDLNYFIITFGYVFVLLYMIINGFVGFPSSQLIYIVSGIFIAEEKLSLFPVLIIGALGHTLGNYILYEISRQKGGKYASKFIKYLFQTLDPIKEIKKVEIGFRKREKIFLFIGKLVNPIKIIIPIPAGISKMNRLIFFIICYITSFIWAVIFVCLGIYFGKSYENFGWIGAVIFGIAILIMLYFYKYINSDKILKEVEKL